MQQFFFVKDEDNIFNRLDINTLNYVEAYGNYCILKAEKKSYTVRKSLKELSKLLQSYGFIQVHRKYLISIRLIDHINLLEEVITLKNKRIPIGPRFKKSLLNSLRLM